MRVHTFNTSDQRGGRYIRPFWRSGAWVLWFGKRNRSIRIEWSIPTTLFYAHIDLWGGDADRDVSISFAFRLLFWSITFEDLMPRSSRDGRTIGLSIYDGGLSWSLWEHGSRWSSTQPKWWSGRIDPLDLLLGKERYSSRLIETAHVSIPLAEGSYPVTIKMREDSWKRSRWRSRRLMRAYIEPDVPIPIPGKGENSWDCGEDALYSTVVQARDVPAAIGELVETVLSSRLRHGGSVDWMPAAAEKGR